MNHFSISQLEAVRPNNYESEVFGLSRRLGSESDQEILMDFGVRLVLWAQRGPMPFAVVFFLQIERKVVL